MDPQEAETPRGPTDSPIRTVDGMTDSRRGRELDARAMLDERHISLFWDKVDDSAGPEACWPWRAALAVNGYGVYGVLRKVDGKWRNRQHKAHRLAWSLVNGLIPDGDMIRHSCDNPPCCNPAHLLIGSGNDNVADKVSRYRQSRGEKHSHIMRTVAARGERAANAKLTADAVRSMREEAARGIPTAEVASRYGVSHITAFRVISRRSWRHIT